MGLREVNKIAYNQWHHERNKNLSINEVAPGSNEIAYWQCDSNEQHVWASHIYARAESDVTCPICINIKVSPDGPELLCVLKEYNSKRAYVSNYWHCKSCKSVWRTESDEVIPTQISCRECLHLEAIKDNEPDEVSYGNFFYEEYPEIAEEWAEENILPATEVLESFPFEVIWKCSKCQLSWCSSIEGRIYNRKSCPYCSKKLPIPGRTSLLASQPEIVEEWAYKCNTELNPDEIFPDSRQIARWQCKVCHILYPATVRGRVQGKENCPNCNGVNPVPPDRYLLLQKEFYQSNGDISDFELMVPTYTAQILWKCSSCNDIFQLSYRERFYAHRDCACIEGRKAIPGKNSFKALYPRLDKELSIRNEIDTDMILPNSSAVVEWDCPDCDMTWKSSVRERVESFVNGDNITCCPYCAGKKPIPGKNSFMVRQPELMKEWHIVNWLFIHPDNILEDCNKKVWWNCSVCQHAYHMSPKRRLYYIKRNRISCLYCKGLRRKKVHFI